MTEEEGVEPTVARKALLRSVAAAESHCLITACGLSAYLVSATPEHLACLHEAIAACGASVEHFRSLTDLLTPTQRDNFEAYLTSRDG